MIEVLHIKKFKDGCFTVTYNVWATCMCSHIRETLVMYRKRKPTINQALKFIEENGKK